MLNDKKQLNIGILLSYVVILIDGIYGFIVVPYILSTLGNAEYGVYKLTASFAGPLMIMDFGMASVMMRYISVYKARHEDEKIPNFIAMQIIQAFVMSIIVILISIGLFFSLDSMYGESLLPNELIKFKQLFVIMVVNVCLQLMNNVFGGVITGHNKFVFENGTKVVRIILRIALVFTLLNVVKNSIVLLLIETGLLLCVIFARIIYIYFKLHVNIKLTHWELTTFKSTICYASLMFVQSISTQMTGNIPNLIIGGMISAEAVGVFSIGLQFFNTFQMFGCAISDVMLPTVTNKIYSGATNREIEDFVARVGRVQFLILGAVIAGFILLGKEFIFLWVGEDFEESWLVAVILMSVTIFPLVENVMLSVLRARNMMGFKTIITLAMSLINFIITWFCVKYYGLIAGAFGTAISIFLVNFVTMNIYYWKKFDTNVFRMYSHILSRVLPALVVTSLLSWWIYSYMNTSIVLFIVKVIIFTCTYAFMLALFNIDKTISTLKKLKEKHNENTNDDISYT